MYQAEGTLLLQLSIKVWALTRDVTYFSCSCTHSRVVGRFLPAIYYDWHSSWPGSSSFLPYGAVR